MLSLPVFLSPPSSLLSHPARHRAVREHLENPSQLVCLSSCHSNFPKTPTTESWQDVLQLALQMKVLDIQDGVGWQLFPAHLQPQKMWFTNQGVFIAFDNMMLLIGLWWLSCLCAVVGKWEELERHKSLHTVYHLGKGLYQCSSFKRSLDVCRLKWSVGFFNSLIEWN